MQVLPLLRLALASLQVRGPLLQFTRQNVIDLARSDPTRHRSEVEAQQLAMRRSSLEHVQSATAGRLGNRRRPAALCFTSRPLGGGQVCGGGGGGSGGGALPSERRGLPQVIVAPLPCTAALCTACKWPQPHHHHQEREREPGGVITHRLQSRAAAVLQHAE